MLIKILKNQYFLKRSAFQNSMLLKTLKFNAKTASYAQKFNYPKLQQFLNKHEPDQITFEFRIDSANSVL